MRIVDLSACDEMHIRQTAVLLMDAFTDSWCVLEEATEEVGESLQQERISRVMIEDDKVLGWVGGIPKYSGNVWEMHPLVVREEYQGQGIGKALVEDFEEQVRGMGGITVFLGTDDENGSTSLANIDLYKNTFAEIEGIENINRHPYEFYQKQGYHIVGVLPDANGIGKPDIFMAKRVATNRKECKK